MLLSGVSTAVRAGVEKAKGLSTRVTQTAATKTARNMTNNRQ